MQINNENKLDINLPKHFHVETLKSASLCKRKDPSGLYCIFIRYIMPRNKRACGVKDDNRSDILGGGGVGWGMERVTSYI